MHQIIQSLTDYLTKRLRSKIENKKDYDAFGAMRSNTRMLVKKIIKKVETKVEAEERPLIGRKVWGTLTTASTSC